MKLRFALTAIVMTLLTLPNFADAQDAQSGYEEFQRGVLYRFGDGVTQADTAEAMEWYRKAADKGYKQAMYDLGVIYYHGDGVTQDYAEAIEWYRKAADHGYKEAMYDLGGMYYNGKGVTQDYAESLRWFKKAADQGHEGSIYILKTTEFPGTTTASASQNDFLSTIDKSFDNPDLLEALKFLMTGDTGWERHGITSYDLKSCKFRYVILDPINKPNVPPSFEYDFNSAIWNSSSFEQVFVPESAKYNDIFKVNCNKICDVMHTQHVSKELGLMMMQIYGFPAEKDFIIMPLPNGISQRRFKNALDVVKNNCPGVKSAF